MSYEENPYDYLFFNDGLRSIDYVLVIQRSVLTNRGRIRRLETFVQNLQKFGFEFEKKTFILDADFEFILLHFREEKMFDVLKSFKYELTMNCEIYNFPVNKFASFFKNFLLKPVKSDPLYLRAPDLFDGFKPTTLTPAERILAVTLILNKNRFGIHWYEFGISELIRVHAAHSAFPIHEGDYRWSKSGPLTRRQLLFEFGARAKRWFQLQPSNMIESYFGTEYAFYHDFMRMYTYMLLIPTSGSILVFVWGFMTISSSQNIIAAEVCASDKLICPRCSSCRYFYLRDVCFSENVSYILFNGVTQLFAILISIWSTILLSIWHRIEAKNQLKWNVSFMKKDISMRPQYKHSAYYREADSGHLEAYVPIYSFLLNAAITFLIMAVLITISVSFQIGMQFLRSSLTNRFVDINNSDNAYKSGNQVETAWSYFLLAIILGIFMIIYQKFCYYVSYKTTEYENPRTFNEFMSSYCFKCYILDFVNFYTTIFFGIVKGNVDLDPRSGSNSLFSQGCINEMCSLNIAILLFTIGFLRTVWKVIGNFIIPIVQYKLRKRKYENSIYSWNNLEQWEKDFLLIEADSNLITHAMLDVLVEYGFLTFFVSAFPLTPALTLISGIITWRIDSYKTMTYYRRPNSRKIDKMLNFSLLLKYTTFIGIITNTLIICFNGKFLEVIMYTFFYKRDSGQEPHLYTFKSKVKTSEVFSLYNYTVKEEYCYYNSPKEERNIESLEFDYYPSQQLLFIIIVHVVVLLHKIASLIIPVLPQSIIEETAHLQKLRRMEKFQILERTVISQRREKLENERFKVKI
ncbi:unnamed protein product [Brassicogethes aeneus]|uniref:Anoctamin n=1 Tax=Brassicogethes aeneus TaxID=1431903 RepID=A0A9P0B0Q2_BRAAE|nr:unnamed protein product [Brassicogethes aeneus]